jgi:ATP-dependent DNA helicase DinG
MEEIFGPDGLIARAHPDYEYRPGQIQMAEAVMRAFEERRHLVVEAGTGTGKTLAYLVPAVAAAVGRGSRVVISTGTKNLQEQLMEKDIPFLQRVLPRKFTAAYMKGRGNYACLNRIKRAETAPVLDGLDDVDYFDEVRRWSRESETGDRAELIDLPENLSFWRHIDARSETCLGQKCPDYDGCYIITSSSPIWPSAAASTGRSSPITAPSSSTRRIRLRTWRPNISAHRCRAIRLKTCCATCSSYH